jgi:DNA adenine methylase
MSRRGHARPVLKWAGGKSQIVPRILELLPEQIETYFEPFVGGGAVFFALAREGRFRRAVIGDSNRDLLCVYRALQTDAERVIRALADMEYSEREYYRIRASKPKAQHARAARVIYLNKTGYNGLYRVNRSGEFNVPFGRYVQPTICDAPNLRAVGTALAGVEIAEADFAETCKRAKPGDAVYLDPPYVPLSRTSNFTAYDRHPFDIGEHRRLARVFGRLGARGVLSVLSNSDTSETRALYGGFELHGVQVARSINSRTTARGRIGEILVVNRPPPSRGKKLRQLRPRAG